VSRRVVVVLGMHRSGTSAVARGLQTLGVDLGNSLIGGLPDNNEKGFWEDKEVNAFNEGLLARLDSSWDRLANFNDERLKLDRWSDLRSAAVALLGRKLEPGRVFGLKDPRMCLLLAFWRDVFAEIDVRASYLVVVRSPIAVAASLAKRDGFPAIKGVLLWAKYSVAAIRATHDQRRVFTAYDAIMDAPQREMKRVAHALDLPAIADADERWREFADDFLTRDLQHHSSGESRLADWSQYPSFVNELYQFMKDVALGKFDLDGIEYRRRWELAENSYVAASSLLMHLDGWERDSHTRNSSGQPESVLPTRMPDLAAAPTMGKVSVACEDRAANAPEIFNKAILRWNLESLLPGPTVTLETQEGQLLLRGWVLGRKGRAIHVAVRQGGLSRCYPLIEERPDVVEALATAIPAEVGSSRVGFRFMLNSIAPFDFGFEIGGVLTWVYHIAPAPP
jgi:hypothetical protein